MPASVQALLHVPLLSRLKHRISTVIARLSRGRESRWVRYFRSIPSDVLRPETLDAQGKKRVFKEIVRFVELEPHSYCNRQCPFCGNATIDRLSARFPMSWPVYEKLLQDLESIDYSNQIRFGRYSEPMSSPDIFKFVAAARERLPRAWIIVVTNGDYLKPDSLARFEEAGLSALQISIYPKKYNFTVETAIERIEAIGRSMGLAPEIELRTEDHLRVRFPFEGVKVTAVAKNLSKIGWERVGATDDLLDPAYARTSPCWQPFALVTIDYNGSLVLCCNVRSDAPEHEKYVFGRMTSETSIFDLFINEKWAEWRRTFLTIGAKGAPCTSCTQDVVRDPVDLRAVDRIGRKLLRQSSVFP